MSVIPPKIPARLRRTFGRFVGPAGAALFSLVLASCAGGGFGGASDTPAVNPVSQPAPVASGPISPASQRNVAEALSGLKLGDKTPPISPENIAVSDDAEILNRNPFSSPPPAARASGWGARADSTRKTPGYKAFEVAVPSGNPLMTVAVWISETPPDYPEGKPEQDPEADRKFLYLRLQVFIEVGHVALVEGGGVEVLESQVIVVEEKRPDPKPQPACLAGEFRGQSGNCSPILGADSLCPAGTMPANGLTQAELNAGLLSTAEGNDLAGSCEYLRRGADVDARESDYKRTALMLAANNGFLDLAKLLHANGADVNLHGGSHDGNLYGRGWSALHYSAVAGNVEIARWLLDAGAALESTWDGVKTALWEASYWGRPGVVELLLSRGADVSRGPGDLSGMRAAVRETTVNYPYTRTMLSYYYPKPSADSLLLVVSLLASGGAELNERRRGGRSILDEAVNRNNARVAGVLRQFGGKCFLATGPLCGVAEVVTAETICESGSLSANGLTQAELDYEFLGAALENDLEAACEYLRRGANIEIRENEVVGRNHPAAFLTALMIAAGRGGHNYPDMTRLLLANGADPHSKDGHGWATALHYAAVSNHTETAALLLDGGADVNIPTSAGDPPLYQAAHWGRADMVQLLLSRGADPDIQADTGVAPLHGAASNVARSGSAAVVSLLLSYGADPNPPRSRSNPGLITRAGETGHSPLDDLVARGYGNYAEAARILRNAGGKCFVRTSPLCGVVEVVTAETVCESGSLSANGLTQAQLDAGLVSEVEDNDLEGACEYLRKGANIDVVYTPAIRSGDAIKRTPLVIAAVNGRLELSRFLLNNGANVDWQSGRALPESAYDGGAGWSALALAAAAGHGDVVGLLLDQGANVDIQWDFGRTALHEAAIFGRASVVELLLARGAAVDVRDLNGETALHGAAWGASPGGHHTHVSRSTWEAKWDKALDLLLDAGAEVNLRSTRTSDADPAGRVFVNEGWNGGWTPLDRAVAANKRSRALKLRARGGVCNVQSGPLCPSLPVTVAVTIVASTVVTAETVCESGSLSANGQTQAQLDAGLISAAKANNLANACEYLRRGASPDSRESRGVFNRTALMIAASDGRLDLAKLLHVNGADVNLQKGQMNRWAYASPGWSALIYAATAGHADMVSWLLDSGADIEAHWYNPGKKTALWEAAHWGRADVIGILLSHGADPDRSDASDAFPLHGGADKLWGGAATPSNVVMVGYSRMGEDAQVKVVSLLAAAVSDVNALENGRTALDAAVSVNHAEVAAVLRNAGGKCVVETGPLCPVVEVVTAETVTVTAETVCESGSLSANGQTQTQLDTGLVSAVKANNLTSACEYLRRGASPDSRESRGVFNRTALMIAASDGRLDLAKLLHVNGADVNLQKGQMNHWAYASPGWSALIYAATAGHADMVSWLLDSGADIEAYWHSPGKKTALWEAAHWGRADVIGILLSHGADPDRSDASDAFPLHGGAGKLWGGAATPSNVVMVGYSRMGEDEAVNVVSLLAAAVSDVNALENGKTALDVAALENRPEVAAVLRNAGGKCVVETGPLCPVVEVATAETVTVTADALECPAGTLPTNGLTAAELNMILRMAARGGDATRVCEALRRGAEVNDNLDDSEFTPLQEAVSGGHLEAAKVLLANGAEVNKRKDGAGHSPLDLAARDGEAEIAALLRNADGRCFVETGPLCQSVPVATPDPVTVVNTVAATVASTVVATVANTVIAAVENTVAATVAAGSCPAGTLPTNGMTQAQLDDGFLGAALENDAEEVCEYLRRGASMEIREDDTGRTALMIAGRYNYADLARLLLSNGAEVDYGSGTGWVALHFASGAGQADVAKVLLDGGGDVNVLSSGGDPPLYQAAHWGRADMVQLLLSRGADPDIQANTGVTPLHGAASNVAQSGSAAVVSLLLSYNADPNLRRSLPNAGLITRAGETGHSPLDDLVVRGYGNYAEAARILRDAGGKCFVRTSSLCQNVPVATSDPVTVVNTVAATVANTIVATVANTVVAAVENTVAATVAAGSCPAGTLDADGMTQAQLDYEFLGVVLENDLEEVCNYLRRGANIEIRTDQVGRPHHRSEESATALMIAGRNNYSDLARLLLSNGADVDSTGGLAGGGWAALHIAAYEDHADVARVLLDGGADPDVDVDFDHFSSWTPLHEAAYYNNWRIMKILLTSGANSNIQTTRPGRRGGAPLHYVFDGTRSGSALAVSVLVAGDADVNLRDSGGNSALDLAANRGDAASAEILRAAGGQCFVSTSSLCGSAPAPAAAAAESAPAADRLRESFAGAFNPSPAFGDAFGATSGSSQRFLSRLDSLMRSSSGSGGNGWDSFAGWQRENEHGRMWFSTGQRGDFGFGAGVGGAGGDLSASPFAAMVGNGMLAGGETGFGADGKLRIAAFADYQARSLLDGTDRQWTKWAASGTAIETAMTEAERFSGLAENQTRGAMTEIHLGGGDLGVALQAGAVSESDAMLSGTAGDENLRGLRSRTAFAGLSGAADLFGSGWRLRGSAHLGRSWAESESMLRDGDLWASAFSAGLERGGWLYSDDGFVLRFSQPLRVESLEMELIGEGGAGRLGAEPSGRQLDVDAAYRLPLSGGGGWLLLSAGVRRDGGHTSSSDLEAGALFSVERGF